MRLITTLLMSACLAVAGNAIAQEKKADKPMTLKECQDYTDMAKKDAAKKDAKKEAACADVMKKAAAPKEEKKK